MNNNKTIGFIYDFDLTLSEEYQQMPLFREFAENIRNEYGIDPEDYFNVLCDGTDIGVGSLEQMLNDVKAGVLPNITNEIMRDLYGPRIELAKGLPGWFERVNQKVEDLGYQASHHVISAGCIPFVEGTVITPHLDSIRAGRYLDNLASIYKIKSVVEPNNKSVEIRRICKGTGINQNLPIDEYKINYDHVILFGDGESDLRMFNFIRERGGYAIGVYGLNNNPPHEKTKNKLDGKVNYILPRDYSKDSIIDLVITDLIDTIFNRSCNYDYRLVSALNLHQLKNKGLIDLTSRHLSSCNDCQERSWPTIAH
tara:strand:- start:571 stop:1503 length:933 start_codon:yes stop_codon:yes gene_type:complete